MAKLEQFNKLQGVELLEVKQFLSERRNRPEFDHKLLKLTYFILREGLISALRKAISHKLPQRNYLTFLKVRISGKEYLNVSRQTQTNPDNFVILNRFVPWFPFDYTPVENEVNQYLTFFNQFTNTAAYEQLGGISENVVSAQVAQPVFTHQEKSGLFIFGLGGYVQMFIMHHFRKIKKIACVDFNSELAAHFKKKYAFREAYTVPEYAMDAVKKVEEPYVIIASFHSTHASIADDVFKANSNAHIFVEKPPCVTLEDLDKFVDLYKAGAKLEFGFNRRFIPFSKYVKQRTLGKKLIISCSIKEVLISENHWYLWKNQGTRVTGNVVHWFDLANYWIDSDPIELNVLAHPDDLESPMIAVSYANGSVLNITASDKGNSLRGVQEKIEVRFENETIFIDDFVSLKHIKSNGLIHRKFRYIRKKGHDRMYHNFRKIISKQAISTYTLTDLVRTSVLTYYASEMLKNRNRTQTIELNSYLV